MNRPDNKTCCLMFLLILGLMIAGCASASDYIDAKMDEPPPDELIALLDSPKRLVRALDGNHTIDTEEADEAAFQIIRKLNGAGSGYWRDFDYLYYYRMRGIRYSYKNSYLYQIYSPMRVLPMAILIPMDQGIVVIVNPYEPAPSCSYELFPGTPWVFDE
ncbi:MAG: hypothetical protein R3C45_02865 [Phycisphaerales bacterium]